VARRDGVVEDIDASRIVLRYDKDGQDAVAEGPDVEIYKLIKYQRSNQNTCFNQKPIVSKYARVKKGDIIADGPATEMGELALGRNVMVAFMSWGGFNFEDSILVSERVIKDDIYTSIHIEEYEVVARDTKMGPEEITRDIPNIGEDALKNLDESGIIRIGAEVKPDDILVGKITPKGETQLSPEEKLLRAIFGEKAGDVKDSSLRVPPGVEGTIIDARVFARKGVEKDNRAKSIEDEEIAKLYKDRDDEIGIIKRSVTRRLVDLLSGQMVTASYKDPVSGKKIVNKGDMISDALIDSVPVRMWQEIKINCGPDKLEALSGIIDSYVDKVELIKETVERKIGKLQKGDELPPGVIKMVKVYVAMKRKLSVGDKMAGRHGNKGVVSRVLPEEDLPYFEDGTPVDIVLNPLGVPSRMNVGQVLETHLGWASKELGRQVRELIEAVQKNPEALDALKAKLKRAYPRREHDDIDKITENDAPNVMHRNDEGIYIATPVFDGASEDEIKEFLVEAGLPGVGQAGLFDGRTGLPFNRKVTVGMMYIMKLHHLVDDKIHARSTGPYSLVTQQPLGGKAQFGGQRLGEMEVWAMEAYGASYTLQEFLTVKSDDVPGRTRMYEKIVKGDNVLEAGLPESFNVLVKELKSLGLDIQLVEEELPAA
ncbi:MAG: DNA-directed RNA polymerase subunit beta, partial [Deltaproteobacteria bacterium]|nr:DNA-directed RNA polymerase subunit beta [Deltaproteobacteria bacterium]